MIFVHRSKTFKQLLGVVVDHHSIVDVEDEVLGSSRSFAAPKAAVIGPHSPPSFFEGRCNGLIPLVITGARSTKTRGRVPSLELHLVESLSYKVVCLMVTSRALTHAYTT